jgi:hypothetical protein
MTRTLLFVVLVFALSPMAATAQESVGRYQALTVPRAEGDASLVLVDTATGRTWILGTAPGAGGKAEPRWQALRFLAPTGGPAQDGDPLYPNASAPGEARVHRPTN